MWREFVVSECATLWKLYTSVKFLSILYHIFRLPVYALQLCSSSLSQTFSKKQITQHEVCVYFVITSLVHIFWIGWRWCCLGLFTYILQNGEWHFHSLIIEICQTVMNGSRPSFNSQAISHWVRTKAPSIVPCSQIAVKVLANVKFDIFKDSYFVYTCLFQPRMRVTSTQFMVCY